MDTYSAVTAENKATGRISNRSGITISSNRRVLYVEDNVFNQALARKLFSKIGCELEIADNGYQALEMITKEKIDLIFMDINMPGLSGYETTIIIREKLRLKIPILALTNCDSEEDIKMSKRVGMNDHLKKPLNEEQLVHSIMRWKKDRLDVSKFMKV